jgi:hypothetical protein
LKVSKCTKASVIWNLIADYRLLTAVF